MRACAASFSGADGVAHHQEADGLQTEFAGQPEVLDRDVGLGAVRGDPADRAAVVLGLLDVLLGAHAGQHQEGDLGFLRRLGGDLDQLLLGRLGEAVVEAGATEAVAVGHLDHRHAGGVEGGDDGADLLLGELVALVVRAVPQRRVGHADVPHRVEEDAVGTHRAHASFLLPTRAAASLAISSPTLVAAAVMMSRLPAYGGR